MFRRQRTLRCPANVWKTIIDTPLAQLPVTSGVQLEATGAPVDGE